MEDIVEVKQELAEKSQALEALQRNFDDFQESSRELEEELEAELTRTQDQVSELTSRLSKVAERLGDQQAKNRAINGEAKQVAVAQAETARLRAAALRAAAEKTGLEQAADELEAKCRAAVAAEEDSRHKLDLAIEEKIFVSNDLEDFRVDALRTERELRSTINDLRQELGRLGNNGGGRRGGSRTPPEMVLPRELSSLSDVTAFAADVNTNDDTATVVDGDDLLLTTQGRLRTADGFGGGGSGDDDGAGGTEDGDGIADELIKARARIALEEEIEGLKAELVNAEDVNDELNVELQRLQDLELARTLGGGVASAGGVFGDKGKGERSADENGGAGADGGLLSPRTQEEQAALKQDLADAMATCEELDQTVTDLTDDLHAKEEQRCLVETRLAEVEAELATKTQSLEDQVLEAKTSASSLMAKLADTAAELRASCSRVEDSSAK
ncbi:unnamed protein product, partial [Hapterophycus canaliculatus]